MRRKTENIAHHTASSQPLNECFGNRNVNKSMKMKILDNTRSAFIFKPRAVGFEIHPLQMRLFVLRVIYCIIIGRKQITKINRQISDSIKKYDFRMKTKANSQSATLPITCHKYIPLLSITIYFYVT